MVELVKSWWPRKKLLLDAAMQLVLAAILRRDYDAAIAEIATAGLFEEASLDMIKEEFPTLEIGLWYLQFLQYAECLLPSGRA